MLSAQRHAFQHDQQIPCRGRIVGQTSAAEGILDRIGHAPTQYRKHLCHPRGRDDRRLIARRIGPSEELRYPSHHIQSLQPTALFARLLLQISYSRTGDPGMDRIPGLC